MFCTQVGDVLVDGGNEWFPNSCRRAESLQPYGIHFIGMGISGGEEGARTGPAIMPGGPREAYDLLEPILSRCAAQVADGPCLSYIGPIGAGNYVKMVHNGIEYGDMQLIAEIYDVLKELAGLDNLQMAQIFRDWNDSELESFLVQITASILEKMDDLPIVSDVDAGGASSKGGIEDSGTSAGTGKRSKTGDDRRDRFVVEKILDKTGMKGTGRWTVQEAAERSVSAPTIAAALDVRYLSGRKEERMYAASVLKGPAMVPQVEAQQIIEDCKDALYAAKICSYAQGMCLIQAASEQVCVVSAIVSSTVGCL